MAPTRARSTKPLCLPQRGPARGHCHPLSPRWACPGARPAGELQHPPAVASPCLVLPRAAALLKKAQMGEDLELSSVSAMRNPLL